MRMNDNELSALADSVREQGLKQEASMTQLVYDSQTGEFRQITGEPSLSLVRLLQI